MNQLASNTGTLARRVRKAMAGLPGLSAPADLIAARHCVDLLAARFKEDPADPRHNLWLAEALLRMQREMRAVVGVRCVVSPTSIITRTAIQQVSRLGDESDGEEPALKLLRRAFALAAARVRENAADVASLHVLARVYLARGMPHESLRLARQAVAVDSPERADVLVTAARALLTLRRRDDAAHTAQRAADDGATVGYDVLVRLLATERSDLTRERLTRVRELRSKVRHEDRARYAGASRTPAEIAQAAKSAQWRKAGTAFTDAAGLAGRARGAIEKGLAA
jgi:hypothetical protein